VAELESSIHAPSLSEFRLHPGTVQSAFQLHTDPPKVLAVLWSGQLPRVRKF